MNTIQMPPPIIVVPHDVVTCVALLTEAVAEPITMVGGWAVGMRLRMARADGRPTEDLDVLLASSARPAAAALRAVDAVQSDPQHPCRLAGLPLLVDLLADGDPDHVLTVLGNDVITDPDGLRLLIPPMARLLSAASEEVVLESLEDAGTRASTRLPRAGALFAAKVANIALEFRSAPKRATDAQDALELLAVFGALGLMEDLRGATHAERQRLHSLLQAIEGSGMVAQARTVGYSDGADAVTQRLEPLLQFLARPLTTSGSDS